MRKLVLLASVVVLAASSVNCANSSEAANSLMAPSATSADARKPGHGSGETGTIALVMVTDNNHDGLASFGDVVTFAVNTTATAYPWVSLRCYQNGTLVSKESN